MTQHDSDKDFLDKLYAQSAIEQPPAELDKHILDLAKAQHQRRGFADALRWQRILSVAAVMVLSVYIFFDISQDHPAVMDETALPAQRSLLKSSPSAPQQEQQENQEAQESKEALPSVLPYTPPKETLKQKAAKQAAEPVLDHYAADEISELSASPAYLSDAAVAEKEALAPTADTMLKEIEQLLTDQKQEEAQTRYAAFKQLYPEYPVPEAIRKQFD